ncbi:uncharacterized protein LOC108594956, partial [Drosophila busckii]|uniref:uncharacterized protein LOC108594956 n=1 Tax=Drosophila busckii TaxID=30019 RepID=UPI00083ECC29
PEAAASYPDRVIRDRCDLEKKLRKVIDNKSALPSIFQTYLSFTSNETLKSHPPHLLEDGVELNPIDLILEEDEERPSVSVKSVSGKYTVAGSGVSEVCIESKSAGVCKLKSRSDSGGGSRLKRNIKNTGSLIVRKLTSTSRHAGEIDRTN